MLAACSGVAQRRVAEQRMDRRQPRVASRGAVAALAVEVLEECADQRRVKVREIELAWRLARLPLSEGQQQTQ
jgi:hypothetical protein